MKLTEQHVIDAAAFKSKNLYNATLYEISIQRAEEGEGINRLTQSRILKGLSRHLSRTVKREEIDEFRSGSI